MRACSAGNNSFQMREAEIARVDYDVRERSEYIDSPANRTATGWAQARALYEAIFGGRRSSDPVRSCAVGASDPAPSKRSTQMMSFMPTLMQTLRMARLLTILVVPALAACGQSLLNQPSPSTW
jgi:hypothetical protein